MARGGSSQPLSGQDLIEDEIFPSWLSHACSAVAVGLGVVIVVAAQGNRVAVAATVGIALIPYLMRIAVQACSWWWSLLTVGALAVLQLGGPAWDWAGSDPARSAIQLSFCLSIWHVIDVVIYHPPDRSTITAALVAATMVGNGFVDTWEATPVWLVGLLLAYVGGRLVRRFGLTVVQLRHAQQQLAEEAVAAERRAIAGEVHDVVAHSLSVTALHVTAARMACDRGDVEVTRASLADAEALVRSSLGDVRRTVRLLRPEEGTAVVAAPPGLPDLAPLVGSVRSAGVPCRLDVTGATDTVDDATGLTVLRVVQEALTNAVRHQVDPEAVVTVAIDSRTVRVEVRSTGERRATAEPGVGLLGMRERVEVHRGVVRAEPTGDGWLVVASIPLDAAGAETSTAVGAAPSDPDAADRITPSAADAAISS